MNDTGAVSNVVPLYQSIAIHAQANPDKPAVIVTGQSTVLTYAALSERIAAAAVGLARMGVRPADHVAVATDQPAEHLIGATAALAVGAVPVPFPHNHPEARDEILDDARPVFIVASSAGTANAGEIPLSALERDDAGSTGDILATPVHGEDIAMIYYTSGTTSGIRKGVLQSHRALEATARYITGIMEISDEIVEFVGTPTDNAFWFGRCRVVLRAGGTVVLNQGSFNPAGIVGAMERYGCNAISGDTPIHLLLMGFIEESPVRSRLRWVKIASQAMATEAKRRIVDLLPNARVVMNYGLTEAMRCCILPMRDHPDKMPSVGRPCPGVRMRITDGEDKPVAVGEIGEVQVAGDNLASGYLNKDAIWQDRLRGGWYATGDLGHLDADGFLFVKGRKDEAFNVGGRTVSPLEVEDALRPFLPNTPFCICGADDPNTILGEVPVLCVDGQWNEPMPWPDLRAAIQARIPKALAPRLAVVVADMPLTVNGKPMRGVLRQGVENSRYQHL